MEYIKKHSGVTPYPKGTKVRYNHNKDLIGTIKGECPCTSDLLHYEVDIEGWKTLYTNHGGLVVV